MQKLKISLVALLFGVMSNAQTADPKVDQYNAWVSYTGNHKVSEKFGVLTEFQWRRSEGFSEPMQNLYRFGVDYSIDKTYMISGGWAYVDNFAYGELKEEDQAVKYNDYRFNEQRLWQQFSINHAKTGRFIFDSRFRLEQRWMATLIKDANGDYVRPSDPYLAANPDVEDWKFRQRVRYRFRAQVPLSKSKMADNTLFFVAADEIFVNFGEKVTANVFDQNRLYLALGWMFNKDFNVQSGYMNQFSEKSNGVAKENNHTFMLAATYNVDFTKMFK